MLSPVQRSPGRRGSPLQLSRSSPRGPPEAAWLVEHGDPRIAVVSNWPLTNALDALERYPSIRREFSAEHVTVYRMD
jgi:hypothetical protein